MNEKTYLTKKRNNRNEEILMNSARRVLQGTDELRGDSFSDCYFFFSKLQNLRCASPPTWPFLLFSSWLVSTVFLFFTKNYDHLFLA